MRRLTAGAASIGLAAFAVALWAQPDALVGVFFDDGVYLSLARALAAGEGYRNIHLPGSPPAVHFPPLYPLLLSLIFRAWPVWPDQLILVRVANSLAFGCAVMVMAWHADRLALPTPVRVTAILLGATAFPLLTVVGVPFSEPLFLVLLGAVVLVSDSALETPGRRRSWLVVGVLLGLAALTRSIGVPLILAVAVLWWSRGRRRESVGQVATAGLLLAPWLLWVGANAGSVEPPLNANYGSYFSEASSAGLAGFLVGLDLRVFQPVAQLLFPVRDLGVTLAGLIVAALCVWGGVRAWREGPTLVTVIGTYLLVVTVWPFPPDRFVWVVVPWILVLLSAAVIDLWNRGTLGRTAVVLLLGTSVVGFGPVQFSSLTRRGFERSAVGISSSYRMILPTIREELPAGAVIASDNEALIHLYTARQAVPARPFRWAGRERVMHSGPERLRFFCEQGVSHIVAFPHHDPLDPGSGEIAVRTAELIRLPNGTKLMRLACSD